MNTETDWRVKEGESPSIEKSYCNELIYTIKDIISESQACQNLRSNSKSFKKDNSKKQPLRQAVKKASVLKGFHGRRACAEERRQGGVG